MTFTTYGSYVLIRVNRETDEQLASGLVVLAGSEPQAIGKVVSVGPAVYEALRPDVTVLFQPFRAIESWREGEDTLLILDDEDIFAAIEGPDGD